MKLFKKALVATAIFGAIGAQAADVTDAVKKTSIQGLAASVAAEASSVRVIVREQLEAGDIIYLQFGEGVNIKSLAIGTVDDTVDGELRIGTNDITIKYGSGTYTLSVNAAESDVAKNMLALEVNTGDPITLDSSFEVEVTDATQFITTKAAQATVTYSAKSGLTGNAKDTKGDNTGLFLSLADQFSATVKKEYNGVIERVSQVSFIKNGDKLSNASDDASLDDALVIDAVDNASKLLSAATPANVTVTIDGNFTDYDTNPSTAGELYILDSAGAVVAPGSVTKTNSQLKVVFPSGGTFGDFQVVLTKPSAAGKKIPVSTFEVDVDVAYGATDAFSAITGSDAGQWILDATIINVPYFPVGFEGVNTQINFANENGFAVDVQVTAIDKDGNKYSGSIPDLVANSTKKVSQVDIMKALKDDKKGNTVPAKSKLSITFNIDADENTVNAYAFSEKVGQGRQSLVTSQQKGIK